MSWLDAFLTGLKTVAIGGAPIPLPTQQGAAINFVNGATAAYNASTGNVDVTLQSLYPSGSGSCAVTFSSTIPASLNLSTSPLATRDWFAPGGTGQVNYRANVQCHSKILGCDQIRGTFDFVGPAAGNISNGMGDGSISLTTAVGDDQYQTVLSSTSGTQGPIDGTSAALGWGYAFRVPADTFSRKLTIYGGSYSCGLTLTATASDGSFAPVTSVVSGTANTGQSTAWTIVYNTARDGQYLSVQVLCTTNLGGSPNIAFTCAMLS